MKHGSTKKTRKKPERCYLVMNMMHAEPSKDKPRQHNKRSGPKRNIIVRAPSLPAPYPRLSGATTRKNAWSPVRRTHAPQSTSDSQDASSSPSCPASTAAEPPPAPALAAAAASPVAREPLREPLLLLVPGFPSGWVYLEKQKEAIRGFPSTLVRRLRSRRKAAMHAGEVRQGEQVDRRSSPPGGTRRLNTSRTRDQT